MSSNENNNMLIDIDDESKKAYQYYQLVFGNSFIFKTIISHLKVKGSRKYDEIHNAFWILKHKHLNLLKYKLQRGDPVNHWSSQELRYICEFGDYELVRMVDDLPGLYYSSESMDSAAKAGRLDILKWLHESKSIGCTTNAMDWAAEKGHFNVVKWLHENRKEGCTNYAMDESAANGHIDVLKWLHVNRKEGASSVAIDAACLLKDHEKALAVVKFLVENRTEGCSLIAARNLGESNNVKLFKYLFEEKRKFRSIPFSLFIKAVTHGSIEILEYVLSTVPREEIEFFGSPDHLQTLGITACNKNQLPMLKLLKNHNILTKNMRLLDVASENGIEMVKWLFENGIKAHTKKAMNYAIDFETIKYLHENSTVGCSKTICDINYNNLEVVQFLLENRKEGCSKQCFMLACETGHLDVVKYLVKKYPTCVTNHGFYSSATGGHLEIFKFIESIYPNYQFPKDLLSGMIRALIEKGHIHLLQYFFTKYAGTNNSVKEILKNDSFMTDLTIRVIEKKSFEMYEFMKSALGLQTKPNYQLFEILKCISSENPIALEKLLENRQFKSKEIMEIYHLAVTIDNIEILKMILKYVSYFQVDWLMAGLENESPIVICLQKKYYDMVKLFFNRKNSSEDITKDVLYKSCEIGLLEIIDHLRLVQCPYVYESRCQSIAVKTALANNQLSVYQYYINVLRYKKPDELQIFDDLLIPAEANNLTLFQLVYGDTYKGWSMKSIKFKQSLSAMVALSRRTLLEFISKSVGYPYLKEYSKAISNNTVIRILKEHFQQLKENDREKDENYYNENQDPSDILYDYYQSQEISHASNLIQTFTDIEFDRGNPVDPDSENDITDNSVQDSSYEEEVYEDSYDSDYDDEYDDEYDNEFDNEGDDYDDYDDEIVEDYLF